MNPAMVYIKIPHPCMGKNICKSEEFSLAKNTWLSLFRQANPFSLNVEIIK